MPFFKWYGGLHRKMLSCFDHLFMQNEESRLLLEKIGIGNNCTVSGDTRFDRVIEIAEKFEPIPAIEQFIGNHKCIVAGSTWKEDEEILGKVFSTINDESIKLIIAPHEINGKRLNEIKNIFPNAILFSQFPKQGIHPEKWDIVIIDSIGLLSRLYQYGYITYIGGGLNKLGVHNVLEAAVYGKPVLYGPYYSKYQEAIELLQSGGGFSFTNKNELLEIVNRLLNNETEYQKSCNASKEYVQSKKGATEKIIHFIQEKRLLIS